MRILSILLYSPPSKVYGGAERQMHSLHKGLVANGIEVHVLANIENVGAITQEYEGVKVWGFRVPMPRRIMLHPRNIRFYVDMKGMVKFVRERIGHIDLVQATPLTEAGMFAYWISKHLAIPWIARIACSGPRSDFNFIARKWWGRKLLPHLTASCSGIIALEEETYREAVIAGFGKEQITTIPNAVILEGIPPVEGVKEEHVGGVMIFLGHLDPRKRLECLARAYGSFRTIWERRHEDIPPGLKIIGGGPPQYIRELSAQTETSNCIEFLGHQDKVEPFLREALCLVNPSESEGFPNAVLEACAFGVPVILSDIPVHRRIARETDMEQYLFPVGNDRILAERLYGFFNLDKGDRIHKRNLSAQFGRRFSKEKRDQEYIKLYERVLNRFVS